MTRLTGSLRRVGGGMTISSQDESVLRNTRGCTLKQIVSTFTAVTNEQLPRLIAIEQVGATVRWLRGKMMTDEKSTFAETAAALQFPMYLGKNWDAFDECFSDADWGSDSIRAVLAIQEADQVLSGGGYRDSLRIFSRILQAGAIVEDTSPLQTFRVLLGMSYQVQRDSHKNESLINLIERTGLGMTN
jgi:hypothetical protein